MFRQYLHQCLSNQCYNIDVSHGVVRDVVVRFQTKITKFTKMSKPVYLKKKKNKTKRCRQQRQKNAPTIAGFFFSLSQRISTKRSKEKKKIFVAISCGT